jgi:hypothetical protein
VPNSPADPDQWLEVPPCPPCSSPTMTPTTVS